MKFACNKLMIIFYAVFQLVFIRSSQQHIYTCDSDTACGCSLNSVYISRIAGGETAWATTWGWAVSISIRGISLCGGSILSSSWILTAAHCVSGVSTSQVTVYAGSNTKFAGQSRVATSITVHPSYVSRTKVNDIALIHLGTPLRMSSSLISAVCIPAVSSTTLSVGEWPSAGLYVVAIGWGTLQEGGSTSTTLQQVTVQTIDSQASTCSSLLNNPQLQFCAGVSGGGKDTCKGDSGGPLMMFTTSHQWVLVGLTSYGFGCARADYPGVYTRVAYYQDWIRITTSGAYTNATSSVSANIDPFSSKASIKFFHNQPLTHLLFLFFSLLLIKIYLS
ncbi:unnamed protein product [Rotaria socialis]|uniref:Peptidase S1 domain-containing protein n=2 Tax=Rotaria socialis TaxID=392032 RepID=A0A818HCE6_9BILA|nr:unnamed protein product [Rotaria socialis]CAF4832488.1 unnamed protein product [Rotaria socialis]